MKDLFLTLKTYTQMYQLSHFLSLYPPPGALLCARYGAHHGVGVMGLVPMDTHSTDEFSCHEYCLCLTLAPHHGHNQQQPSGI